MSPRIVEIIRGGVPPSHYAAIAMVAANWAMLERLVDTTIWRLAEVQDEPGACITAQIPNIARRLDAMMALVKLRGASDRLVAKINKFIKQTHSLATKRNRVVHDPWVLEKGTGKPHRFEISAQNKLIFEYVPMGTDEVAVVVNLIHDHINRYDDLLDAISAELYPLPEKSP
jgi:hypothetical protein